MAEYTKSDLEQAAQMALAQLQANKPTTQTNEKYTDQINTLLQNLTQPAPAYDMANDATYQNYKSQYQQQGKQAMLDSTAQATALSGGFGNSYAGSVGNQAYQGYLQGLNNIVPSLQQNAANQQAYDKQSIMNQISALQSQDSIDYSKQRDKLSDYNTELSNATNLTNNEYSKNYGQYRDTVADSQTDRNYNYQVSQAAQTQANYEKDLAYAQAAEAAAEAAAAAKAAAAKAKKDSEELVKLSGDMKTRIKSLAKEGTDKALEYMDKLQSMGVSLEDLDYYSEIIGLSDKLIIYLITQY